jgi:hypothetical protein
MNGRGDDDYPKEVKRTGDRRRCRNLPVLFRIVLLATLNRFQHLSSPPPSPPHFTRPRIFLPSSAGVALVTVSVSHRINVIQSAALVRPKDNTLPFNELPHPIILQCLPFPTPHLLLEPCHLDVSRTETLIDIVSLPYSAWPLNKMWRLKMIWPEVCICTTLCPSFQANINVSVSAEAFTGP